MEWFHNMKRKKYISIVVIVVVFIIIALFISSIVRKYMIQTEKDISLPTSAEIVSQIEDVYVTVDPNYEYPQEDRYEYVKLDDDTYLSLYLLDMYLHGYKLLHNLDENIITAYDVYSLVYEMNESKYAEFEKFVTWFKKENGSQFCYWIKDGLKLALDNCNDKAVVNNKTHSQMTYEDWLKFENWIKENPDYDLAKENYCYYYLLEALGFTELPRFDGSSDQVYVFY